MWKAKYFKYSEIGKFHGGTVVGRTDNIIRPRLQLSSWYFFGSDGISNILDIVKLVKIRDVHP
jgi:hypothetical protein